MAKQQGNASSDHAPAALEQLVSAAQSARPTWSVDQAGFRRFLQEKLASQASTGQEGLHAAELYLAFASACHDQSALAELEASYLGALDSTLRRAGCTSLGIDEVKSLLRERLLVGVEGGRPKILEYSGRGELLAWIRISASRIALRAQSRPGKECPAAGDELAQREVFLGDTELTFLKDKYSKELEAAFKQSLCLLSDTQRDLLRQHFLEGMTTEAIASAHGVHRATAVRWIAQARRSLIEGTRQLLERQLRLSSGEYQSMVRLVRSQLQLSLTQLLPRR
ncbi:MAG: hypothetical protein HY901_05525 [Deltaproteobacteria bacterium]|nr:hypothetical protein [Deltaproteobacteria bacterium]